MPVYHVTSPDGAVYEVNAPEGASEQDAVAYVQKNHASLSAMPPKKGAGANSDIANLMRGKKPAQNEWLRAGEVAGRNLAEGAAGTIGLVTDPFVAMWNKITGRQDPGAAGAVGMALDKAGVPRAREGGEQVIAAAERGMGGSLGFLGLGRSMAAQAPGVVRNVGGVLSAGPGQQIVGAGIGGAAAESTRQAGGGPVAQGVAGLAGGLLPTAVVSGGAMGLRGLARGGEAGRQAMDQSINDFRSVGAVPSVGQAAGNRRTQGAESLLSAAPTSSGVLARAAETQADSIGAGLRNKADALYPKASAESAGRAVERGVDAFANNVKGVRNRLYAAADAAMPPTTPVGLTNTRQTLLSLTTPNPAAKATTGMLVNPRIADLAQNIEADIAAAGGQGLPYEAIKAIRSRIGEELSDFALSADRPTAQYKALYAALSRDMEAAASAAGPQAEQAMKRANGYFKASAERLTQLERVVDKAGGPEKVYAAVMSGTQDGGTTLRAVMQSLPPDGQRAVTAAVIKRMGLATKGNQDAAGEVFSAQTFLTNWNKISPEARRALFDRYGPRFSADMDKVARVADRIRTGSKVFANPSGTANRAAALTYAGSLGASILTGQAGVAGGLAVTGVGSNVLARWMTNPRFVAWLARATEVPKGAALQQAVVLKGIAQQNDDAEMAAYADALAQQAKEEKRNAANQ